MPNQRLRIGKSCDVLLILVQRSWTAQSHHSFPGDEEQRVATSARSELHTRIKLTFIRLEAHRQLTVCFARSLARTCWSCPLRLRALQINVSGPTGARNNF